MAEPVRETAPSPASPISRRASPPMILIVLTHAEASAWRHALLRVHTLDLPDLSALLDRAREIHHRAENLLTAEGIESFQTWAADAADSLPGRLHQWS